jgi:hypothetical protein
VYDVESAVMPYHFEFDSENKILLLVAEGHIQDQEVLAINDIIEPQVKRLQPSAGITDLSVATSFDVSSQALRTAALQPSPYPDDIPRFIIAPEDLVFGLARMYEMVGHSTRTKLKVVRSREEVLKTLGVTNPKFARIESD